MTDHDTLHAVCARCSDVAPCADVVARGRLCHPCAQSLDRDHRTTLARVCVACGDLGTSGDCRSCGRCSRCGGPTSTVRGWPCCLTGCDIIPGPTTTESEHLDAQAIYAAVESSLTTRR